MKTVFPGLPHEHINHLGERSFRFFIFSFFEIFRIPSQSTRTLKREIVFEGLENFEQAFARGKGILCLSLHLGSGDRAIAGMNQRGYAMNVITKRFRQPLLNSLWFMMRGFQGTQYIEAHDQKNAFHILKALKKKEVVVFVMDQFMGMPYGIEVPFFGKPTGTAVGLAVFARKTLAPVVPMWTYTHPQTLKTHICAGPAIDAEGLTGDNADQKLTLIFNQSLEKIIHAWPEHWMWFHRRWKTWE